MNVMDRFPLSPQMLKVRLLKYLSRPGPLSICPAGPSLRVDELQDLLQIPATDEFVAQAYRRILGREPDVRGAVRYSRLLKLGPLYPRRKFLQNLLDSKEYHDLLRHQHLDVQRQCSHLDQQRRSLEQERQLLERQLHEQQQQIQFYDHQLRQHQQLLEQKQREEWLERLQADAEADSQRQQQLLEEHRQHREWQEVETRVLSEYGDLLGIEDEEAFTRAAFGAVLGREPGAQELADGCGQLHGASDQIRRAFLHQLLTGTLTAPAAAAEPVPVSRAPRPPTLWTGPRGSRCRVCGGALVYRWTHRVLRGRHVADYFECSACHALQIPCPFWLGEAYAEENAPQQDNPDSGRFMRNFSAYSYFVALHRAGVVPERPTVLDFGGGYGLLTQMLLSGGFDAWQTDPYVKTPFLAGQRAIHSCEGIAAGSFDLVFALEVLEHLTDPLTHLEKLTRILKPGGTLMISTEIYEPTIHDASWRYLATDYGQHVTLWSRDALLYAAGRCGYRSVGYFPADNGFCTLFSHLPPDALRVRLASALAVLGDPGRMVQMHNAWDFRTYGYVQPLAEPVVHVPPEGLAPGLALRRAS
jgi:SAM-dependent methyltransferase